MNSEGFKKHEWDGIDPGWTPEELAEMDRGYEEFVKKLQEAEAAGDFTEVARLLEDNK